jgi:hypothetical protein
MSVVITEKQLEETCQRLLPDEQVLATGLFQPYGSGVAMGEGIGAGSGIAHAAHVPGVAGALMSAAAGFAAQRGLASAEHQPPWTVLAVTPTKIYAFDASAAGGLSAKHDFSGPPYATWDRDAVAVHTTRYVTSFTLAIDDPQTATSYEYKGNAVYKMGGKLVAHLLTEHPSG